ncbi:hypothetical protein KVV02_005222 [Mortierella alpina]|uniref:Uncharacterized protein n=1 Tax=Mortierella alpina TaxID=64518 RepID=A0A9P7ZY17_MORAP|nr:hypothetical protein KVV02_005222 [Mortierella alpina]
MLRLDIQSPAAQPDTFQMRIRHFCIGSLRTQDLLISKSCASQEDTDIQKVWATFLDLLQSETRWTPFRSQLHPDRDTDHLDRQKSPPPQSPPLPLGSAPGGARTGSASASVSAPDVRARTTLTDSKNAAESTEFCSAARPLFSQDLCFVYKAVNDIVLIACCPLPPTPSTASSTVTRIPNALPGQHAAPSNINYPLADLTSSASSLQTDATGPRQMQPQRHDLAFSTATAMNTTWHGMIEFLNQLIKALERYLLSQGTPETGAKRLSSAQPSAYSTAKSSTTAGKTLSADIVQLNSGIVYEVLDECLELGYPMMPSLAQLDLLVFGVPKLS